MLTVKHIIQTLSELIFPSNIYCISCGALIDETRPYGLCDTCVRDITWNTGRTCAKCGKALSASSTGDLCHDCKYTGRRFDSGISCATYAGPVQGMIRGMKYRDMSYVAYKIADAMYDRYIAEGLRRAQGQTGEPDPTPRPAIAEGLRRTQKQTGEPDPTPRPAIAEGLRQAQKQKNPGETDPSPQPAIDTGTGELSLPDMIVSVPMNEVKKRTRGYDQAEVIGAALAGRLGVPYKPGLLVRRAETSVMSSLSRAERGANTVGAFELRRGTPADCCRDRHIMLVDDVYTTGSTADACAAVLKDAGAKTITIFTFATGTDMHITSERNG